MDFSKLEEYLSGLSAHGIPACDIMVMKDHKLLYRTMAGYSDHEGTVPVSDKDLYNIYSNTKIFTVVAIMQLIEQGKLALEDKLSDYIPAFKDMTFKTRKGIEKATTPITIYHLLTMTSGLSYDASPSVNKVIEETNNEASTMELINALAKDTLLFNPGERWKYSKSHDVLGAVIEVVSGMKFGDYLKKYIMDPLGMKYTTFDFFDPYVQEHISGFYEYDGVNQVAKPLPKTNSNWSNNAQCGGAGLYSCTEDYILLMDALANEGVGKTGERILSEESIEKIKEPQLDLLKQSQFILSHFKKGYSYGLGVRTLIDKGYGARTPLGEFAWDGMTGGYGLVDTENHIAICYMQNVSGCSYAWHNVFPETRDMIYDILGIE